MGRYHLFEKTFLPTPDDASKSPEQKIALLKEQLVELNPAMESQTKAVQAWSPLSNFTRMTVQAIIPSHHSSGGLGPAEGCPGPPG